jgi:hypothetical protein
MPLPNFDRTIDHNEWVLDRCGARAAWEEHGTKGENVTIAQADVGWTNHPQLPFDGDSTVPQNYRTSESKNFLTRNSASHEWDVSAEDDLPPKPRFAGHGTSTASVIVSPEGHQPQGKLPQDCQEAENSRTAFVTGVAPGAVLIPFKVTKGNVILGFRRPEPWLASDLNSLRRCLEHCLFLQKVNPRLGVFTMSMAAPPFASVITDVLSSAIPRDLPAAKLLFTGAFLAASISDAVLFRGVSNFLRELREKGIIIFCAAGQVPGAPRAKIDQIKSEWIFPANNPNTIGVAASDINHDEYDVGIYGHHVDISAPGVDVWRAGADKSTVAPGSKNFFVARSSGSSYATAIAAGVCALWQSFHTRDRLIGRPSLNQRGLYPPEKLISAYLLCVESSSARTNPTWFDNARRGLGIVNALALLDEPLPSLAEVNRFHRDRFNE